MKRKKRYWGLSILAIVLFIGIWWFCCDVLKMTKASTLPGPFVVFQTFIKKLTSTAPDGATLITHIAVSLKTATIGWLMGIVIGVPLGIFMAWVKPVDLLVRPIFDLIRPVPGPEIFPVAALVLVLSVPALWWWRQRLRARVPQAV